MKLIRNSVFETNSSSCHSISVDSTMILNNIPTPDENGEIFIGSRDFGWEYHKYNYFYDKAAYLIVYIRDWTGSKVDEFKAIFENVVSEVTGCTKILYEDNFWVGTEQSYPERKYNEETKTYEETGKIITYTSYTGGGYIDHQSVEDRDLHYMFEDINSMKSFLFSSNSVLTTDNDNH